jgi:hypothetical protein
MITVRPAAEAAQAAATPTTGAPVSGSVRPAAEVVP